MEFHTKRLRLRPFYAVDVADTVTIYQNPAVCRYLLHEPWSDQEAPKLFEQKCLHDHLTEEHSLQLAVEYDQRVIGDLTVFYPGMKETVEIGYVFNPDYAGKGLATEALLVLVRHLFKEQHVHRIQAVLDRRNIASAKVCQRIGMRLEGDMKQDFWNKGEWTDTLIYGMLAEDLVKEEERC